MPLAHVTSNINRNAFTYSFVHVRFFLIRAILGNVKLYPLRYPFKWLKLTRENVLHIRCVDNTIRSQNQASCHRCENVVDTKIVSRRLGSQSPYSAPLQSVNHFNPFLLMSSSAIIAPPLQSLLASLGVLVIYKPNNAFNNVGIVN